MEFSNRSSIDEIGPSKWIGLWISGIVWGQFYATLQSGYTTANVALKRLNSMSPKNEFYRANRELGRIFKTEFILQYMSQPALRRRVRRGLLKVEQLFALARDVVYGKRGQMTERDFQDNDEDV